jgi:autotransporter strand-loop-strand O-heptosyltransferase
LCEDDSIHLLSCDFQKVTESDRKLHSLSLVKNNTSLKDKIKNFHPQVNYLNNLNYYCFGVLRCFKNSENINFYIKDYDACGEDSYRTMFMNSFGKWLHIPRNLYTWNLRQNSESHSFRKENFNNNFDIAYEALMSSESIVDNRFNNLYKETCALNFLNINFEKSISLFSKNKNISELKELFFDKKINFNDFSNHDFYVIVLNDFSESEIKSILIKIKNKNADVLFYRLTDDNFSSNHDMDCAINNNNNYNISFLNSIVDVKYWFAYIRHFYLISNIKSNTFTDFEIKDCIKVSNFSSENCKVEYSLNNGLSGEYVIKILDQKTNMLLYTEKINLNYDIDYWTAFSFFKDIIYNSVLIIFEYENDKVFEQSFIVNHSPTSVTKLFEKDYFKKPIEAYSYVEVFCHNQYSKYGITVEPNDIVVDIGANVGAFIKLALINNCDKIFSCEPNDNCVSIINEIYGKNKNLIINDYAIYYQDGLNYLDIDPQNNTSGNAKLIDSSAISYSYKNNIQIKTKTFKNFLFENSINKIDFLKIDCEGGEDFIFTNENKEFIKENVKKIVVETHGDSKNEIMNMLQSCDFNVIEDKITQSTSILYAKKIIKDNTINIINESGSLGDAIAWVPMVNEFAKNRQQKVNLFTPYKNLFEGQYELINFYDYVEKPNDDSDKLYRLGCFDNMNWKKYSLQEIACKILDIKYIPVKPLMNLPKSNKNNNSKKYVCIATQSTSQCKYWNNKDGWNRTINYLKSIGYDVICIDRYSAYGIKDSMNIIPENCINDTGDKPLSERMKTLIDCEFFIGLGSGLSWLAWGCNKPVIMISGFSDPSSEFYTPYRVHNKNVCNSCWNDESINFDKSNWMWCPRNKDFECSKQITFEMVKEKIDLCIQDIEKQKSQTFNLKSVHLLIDVESERESLSIKSMQKINSKIPYVQCINKKYEGSEWKNKTPICGFRNHGPGHYGLFQSLNKAILEHFTEDLDALLIFEADCVLNISEDLFVQKVNEAVVFCNKYDLPYFSFGPRVINGYLESNCLKEDNEFPDFIITDKIIQTHCILITKKYRNYVLKQFNESWDAADLWFNEIFKNFKMGIVKKELAYQTYGFSMIDNCFRGQNK